MAETAVSTTLVHRKLDTMLSAFVSLINRVDTLRGDFKQRMDQMAGEMDALRAEIEALAQLTPNAVQKIENLHTTVGNSIDPSAVQQLADRLRNDVVAPLTAAVNTPAPSPVAAAPTA